MRSIPMIIALLLLVPSFVHGQDDCPLVVDDVLAEAKASCAALESGEICLGHPEVTTVVNCETLPEFDSAGDTIPINSLCAMRLGAMQPSGEWGIAIMRVLPTHFEQSITMALLGDIEIQNAASAASQVKVWVTTDTEVHSGPGSSYAIIETLPAGAVVLANACNCTRHWLRVVIEDNIIGWIPTGKVSIIGNADILPEVERDTPLYASMQAFKFHSGDQAPPCSNALPAGILIQMPSELEPVPLQINGVELSLNATAFVQSQPSESMSVTLLDGTGQITAYDFTAVVPAGTRVSIPMSEENMPNGLMQIEPYTRDDVATLPLGLLPEPIDPMAALTNTKPYIVGVEECTVIADMGDTLCPVHFVNYDGDAITRMEVEFLYAPQGEWQGSIRESPELTSGNTVSGALAWNVACSLGGENFIGPVRWEITLMDSSGHASPPFEASFNCVAG